MAKKLMARNNEDLTPREYELVGDRSSSCYTTEVQSCMTETECNRRYNASPEDFWNLVKDMEPIMEEMLNGFGQE